MTKLEIWLDKLPEDKAKHYNRSRMSMELFARKIGYNANSIIEDFKKNGYIYIENERKIIPSPIPCLSRIRSKYLTN